MAEEIEPGVVVINSQCFSCSGVILDVKSGTVLTIGSIANDFLSKTGNKVGENCFDCKEANEASSSHAITTLQVVVKRSPSNSQRTSSKDYLTLDGSIIAVWRDQNLYALQKKVFPEGEWTFESEKMEENGILKSSIESQTKERKNAHCSLADFALIKVKELEKYTCKKMSLTNGKIQVGDSITVVGTPFGSECYPVFFNSLSKGIVSNIIGSNNEVILTDARCIPGSEGCPVFIESSQSLFGIVVAPFSWRSGEWIGLSLVCSLANILKHFLSTNIVAFDYSSKIAVRKLVYTMMPEENATPLYLVQEPSINKFCFSDSVNMCVRSVVLVQAGSTWGSGIIIDANKGLVITCRHVLTNGGVIDNYTDKRTNVPLSIHNNPTHTVYHAIDILFTTESDCPLDFALLKVLDHNFTTDALQGNIKGFATNMAQGCNVFAVGYSVFGSQSSSGPCVTIGTISKVSCVDNKPIMLQTTAAVHGGGSGGAVISEQTGQLLGMTTCNVKEGNTSASFPHINFSIPINIINELLELSTFNEIERKVHLSRLVSGADRIWYLASSQPTKSKL